MQKDSGITKAGAESNKSAETVDSRAHEEKSTDPDSSWIVQSSTKPRRLVPQHTLTRQELGMDNNRPRSTPAEPTKRKVIRFTKDELLTRRKEEKILPSITHLVEIIADNRQDPVTFTKLDPDDVLRIWSNHNKEASAARGRGRGRGRPDDAAGETEWSKPEDRKSDLWSSNFGASSPGDLSDFAAAALNFRSQLSDMVLEKGVDDKMEEEEDLMEKLLREQSELTAGDDSLGLEEDLPAWATSLSVTQESVHPVANVSSSNSASIGGITIDGSHMVSFLPSASLSQPIFSDLAPARSTSSALNNFSIIDGPISLIPDVRQNTIPEWFYLDPQGKIQGPFSQDNMRLWHEGGYFPRDLPIKLRTWSNFHPFIDVFEDLRLAFFSVPSEPRIRSTILALSSALNTPAQSIPLAPVQSQSDVQFMNSRVEESRGKLVKPNNPLDVSQEVELESWKPSRPAQPQPKEVPVEKAPQDTQSARAASSSQSFPVVHSVAKSDFAKQLLGIGAKPSPAPSSNDETPTNPTPAVAASNDSSAASSSAVHKDAPDSAQVQTRTSKGWVKAPSSHPAPVSLAEIQQEEEQARLKVKQTPVSPPPNPDMSVQLKSLLGVKSMPAKSGGSPWNTTEQATLAAQAASLRDIMQEEESSVQQKKELTKGNPASSWATKAKSTTGSGPVVPVAMEQPRAQFTESKPKPVQESVVPSVALHSAGHRSTPPQPLQGKSEFGGRQMSKEMADWCGAQLKRITGSDDLTLMHFCMSLSSATEIRETLASYLGSSPQTTNFATDFIKYRDEGKRPIITPINPVETSATRNDPRPGNGFTVAAKKKKAGGK